MKKIIIEQKDQHDVKHKYSQLLPQRQRADKVDQRKWDKLSYYIVV